MKIMGLLSFYIKKVFTWFSGTVYLGLRHEEKFYCNWSQDVKKGYFWVMYTWKVTISFSERTLLCSVFFYRNKIWRTGSCLSWLRNLFVMGNVNLFHFEVGKFTFVRSGPGCFFFFRNGFMFETEASSLVSSARK